MAEKIVFVLKIIFIGNRLRKEILYIQLIICFFGNSVAIVHSLQ